MNVIFFGSFRKIRPLLNNVITVLSDASSDEFREVVWDYKRRKNISIVFHLPMTVSRQNQVLKFTEEFKGDDIVLYSAQFRADVIDTILTRFSLKIDESLVIRPELVINEWKKKIKLERLTPISYRAFHRGHVRTRVGRLYLNALNKLLVHSD